MSLYFRYSAVYLVNRNFLNIVLSMQSVSLKNVVVEKNLDKRRLGLEFDLTPN
jgi:hypothetical protein